MTCSSCEAKIENTLRKLDGIVEVKAVFSNNNVHITYDADIIGLEKIINIIEDLDYDVKEIVDSVQKTMEDKMPIHHLLGIGIISFVFYFIIKNTVGFDLIPEINQSMGYGILFVVGLLTSLHCISMCGGINLSQSISCMGDNDYSSKFFVLKSALLYNGGRVISYTIIGGLAGALGFTIGLPGAAKGIVAVISGVFMVIMGLNILNIFPWLRKLNLRMPKTFAGKIRNNKSSYGPFYVGLLNGLMPCGPLQSMQIYALGTGSIAAGAFSMFIFSMGTVPLMFGFGALSSILNKRFTTKMMKVSAVLVIVLGLVMTNRGLVLSGFSFSPAVVGGNSKTQKNGVAIIQDDIQVVMTKLSSGYYEPIKVQKGIPVRWTIKAQKSDINGCNNEIIIPAFNMSKKLEPGDNVIEFIPTESGSFTYSCWMGMIRSKIIVVDDMNNVDKISDSSRNVQNLY